MIHSPASITLTWAHGSTRTGKIFPSAAVTYWALILGLLFHGDFEDWDGCGADFALIQGFECCEDIPLLLCIDSGFG